MVGFVLGLLHGIAVNFVVLLIVAAKPIALLLPVIIASALILQTGRRATMIYGACVGLLVGWPVTALIYGDDASIWPVGAGSAGAGAMSALALWQSCLKHYSGGNIDIPDGRRASMALAAKGMLVIGGLLVVVFFL